ncbi:MAG TPA: hemin uptake protein HemP [Herbaspirillum sp.]|nr:hemin uptake protein HemP [Herbaspirillum sp.]
MAFTTRTPDHVKPAARDAASEPIICIKSQDLFQKMRELKIDHRGRIYTLRLTQLDKMILTA